MDYINKLINYKKVKMQPLAPAAFPRKEKRFQSLSMTPLDSELDLQNTLSPFKSSGSNKINWIFEKRLNEQSKTYSNTNSDTNQFLSQQKLKQFDPKKHHLKYLERSQLQLGQQEQKFGDKGLVSSDHKNHRKMITSDIFIFSSMLNKNSFSDGKSTSNQASKFSNDECKSFETKNIKRELNITSKKEKEIRIPSFILNKKKKSQNYQNSTQESTEFNMTKSVRLFSDYNKSTSVSFKKSIIEMRSKNSEKQYIQSQFEPPSNEKIAFSKATASTLYTNLPRQESRRTFRDFEELVELKEIENSIEESDSSNAMQMEFENLFSKEEQTQVRTNILESEIAELFSDDEVESEEFNEQLKQELQDLF